VKRSKNVLLLGAAVALALPALASAQVTPFKFVENNVDMEFTTTGSDVPHTFDLRSLIALDTAGTFNPSQVGAKLTISQNGATLFSLPMPAGADWRFDSDRIRFDGDVAGVALSVDFRLRSGGSFAGTLAAGTVMELNFEGDAADAPALTCVEGVATTVVAIQIGLGAETASSQATVPASC
jgi:hypothetical protein